MNKKDLNVGDIIRFHDWGVGGFLFGIIVEQEDDLYHSKLNIWRSKDIYYLQANGINEITLIKDETDINAYELHDFQDLIINAEDQDICFNLR